MKTVAVIGAGTLGAACAYYLSKQENTKVILIDRGSVGSGATSWAASLLTTVRSKTNVVPLVQETYRSFLSLEKELGISLGARQVGSLQIVASEKSQASINRLDEIADDHGLPRQWLTPAQIKNKLPWMNTSSVDSGLYFPNDVFLDAHVLANAFANAARKNGATIRQFTDVEKVFTRSGRVIGLKLWKKERLKVNTVIDAAGAWSNLLSVPLNLPLPYAPVRSIYWITSVDEKRFPSTQPMTVIPDAQAYTRPETGALLFGIRDKESAAFNPKELPRVLDGFKFIEEERQWDILWNEGRNFLKFFPGLEEVEIAHTITGFSTYTSDSNFILGPVKELEGFYVATGCVGAGVAMSGGFGRAMAEYISGAEPFTNVEAHRPDRMGEFDAYSDEFLAQCSASRSNKRDGG